MEVKRPTWAKVGAHHYRILWSKDSWKKYATPKEIKSTIGLCRPASALILIKYDICLSQQQDTLVHELLHAAFSQVSFDTLPIILNDQKPEMEELIVLLLTPTIHQILRDNPHIVEWIQSG